MQEVAGKHLLCVGIDTIYIDKNESNKRNKEEDEPSQTEMTHDVRPVTWLNSPCSSEGHDKKRYKKRSAIEIQFGKPNLKKGTNMVMR